LIPAIVLGPESSTGEELGALVGKNVGSLVGETVGAGKGAFVGMAETSVDDEEELESPEDDDELD